MNEINEDLPVAEGWTVNSATAAEWALRKIREAREMRDLVIEAADGIIAEEEAAKEAAGKRCQRTEEFFTEHLRRWFDRQTKRETKTGWTVDLPSGKLTAAKAGKTDYIRDEDTLIECLKRTSPELVKTVELVNWAELKKRIVTEDGLVALDTGEVLEGIRAEALPPEFKVRV